MSATPPATCRSRCIYPRCRSGRRHRRERSTALADRLEGKLRPIAGMLLTLRKGILEHINERAEEDRFPVTPQRIVHDVRAVMPEDGIVCLDNGMYKIWFARNYRTHVANTLLLDNALATMGAGLPSAIDGGAAQPAAPRDGGVRRRRLHDEQPGARDRGAAEARPRRADRGGFRLWHDPLEAGGRPFPRFRHDLRQSRFRRLCRDPTARTATGSSSAAELVPTLEAAFTAGGVHLVAVPIDYCENTRVLVDELGGRIANVDVD